MEQQHDAQIIRKLADKIRDLYTIHRTQVFGSKRRLGDRYDKWEYWDKIAIVCLDLNAAPEDYLRSAFERCASPKSLLPHMLYGPQTLKWYKETMQFPLEDMYRELIRTSIPNESIRLKQNFIEVLLNPKSEIPLIIRYAYLYENKEFFKQFGEDAYKIIETRPDSIKAIKNLLPNFTIQPLITYLDERKHIDDQNNN